MIRIQTVRELSSRNRAIARARWRVWWRDEEGHYKHDTDGVAWNPATWSRWEEEYFIEVRQANAASIKDAATHIRPHAQLDQVSAKELWSTLLAESQMEGAESDMLSDYEEGRLRVLYPQESGPWRLKCDQALWAVAMNGQPLPSSRGS